MRKRGEPQRYRLFYIIGDADSVKAKSELREAGVTIRLDPVDEKDAARLGEDFIITRFPALFSNRACWQGLPAIRSFILRRKRGK